MCRRQRGIVYVADRDAMQSLDEIDNPTGHGGHQYYARRMAQAVAGKSLLASA